MRHLQICWQFSCWKMRRDGVGQCRPVAAITLRRVTLSPAAPKVIWVHAGKNSWEHLTVPFGAVTPEPLVREGWNFRTMSFRPVPLRLCRNPPKRVRKRPKERSTKAVGGCEVTLTSTVTLCLEFLSLYCYLINKHLHWIKSCVLYLNWALCQAEAHKSFLLKRNVYVFIGIVCFYLIPDLEVILQQPRIYLRCLLNAGLDLVIFTNAQWSAWQGTFFSPLLANRLTFSLRL